MAPVVEGGAGPGGGANPYFQNFKIEKKNRHRAYRHTALRRIPTEEADTCCQSIRAEKGRPAEDQTGVRDKTCKIKPLLMTNTTKKAQCLTGGAPEGTAYPGPEGGG